MIPASSRVLVVDDNEVDQQRVERLIRGAFEMSFASTASAALEMAEENAYDCVLLDYHLPDRDGLELLDTLVSKNNTVVMLTGAGDERVAVDAMKRGAQDYVAKDGLKASTLERALRKAMENVQLRRRIEEHQNARAENLRRLDLQNRALRQRDAEVSLIFEQLPGLVWTTDATLRCASVGGSGGKGIVAGSSVMELLEATEASDVMVAHRAALVGKSASFEHERSDRWLKGRVRPLYGDDRTIVGVIGVALDNTEVRVLTQQLLHSQKMEALGRLAGGVAHDFNNLLTVIMGFTEAARVELPEAHLAHVGLDEVSAAADRAASLVSNLLAFSRRRVGRSHAVDVAELVNSLVRMLSRLLGATTHLEVVCPEGLWLVHGEPAGIEQILVNLVVNARDAVEDGGRVLVTARNASLDEEHDPPAGLSPGEYVVLSVSDNGAGIPPDVVARVFDPFYTTKPVGEGTGLGLATCFGIARSLGGAMGIHSELGLGTTVRAYLPRSHGSRPQPAPRESSRGESGTETLLVVEDDPQVLRAITRSLSRYGYQLLTASNAHDALAVAEAHGHTIDLLLCDIVMPDVSGPEVAVQLRPLLPAARTLFMSGYAPESVRRRFDVGIDTPILEKPFTTQSLTDAVRRVLDGPASG